MIVLRKVVTVPVFCRIGDFYHGLQMELKNWYVRNSIYADLRFSASSPSRGASALLHSRKPTTHRIRKTKYKPEVSHKFLYP